MSKMQRIRDYYRVPAKRGGRVKFRGQPAVITGAPQDGSMHLNIRLDGDRNVSRVHPTWEMKYL
jgi:hypothetical protein